MATIRVEFEVPDDILTGLATGKYERVGGVIRHFESKQVFAWLREGGNMSRSGGSTSTLLPSLFRAAGMKARTAAVVAGAVTVAGPLLDVAITGYTIYRLTERIRALKKEIAHIYDRLDKHLQETANVKLNAALKFAEAFLEQDDYDAKKAMLPIISFQLVVAEQWLLAELRKAMKRNRLRRARNMMAAVCTVNTMAARCYLEVGDTKSAVHSLNNNIAELKPYVESLVQKLVGNQPALYFHKSVKNHYLDRYIKIRAWLDTEENIWASVAKEARKDFWNEKAVKRLFREHRRFLHTWHEIRKTPFYIKAIPRAEELIESFQRFESYALELESPDRPSQDWEALSKAAAKRLADHDDYYLIIDDDALRRVGARLMS